MSVQVPRSTAAVKIQITDVEPHLPRTDTRNIDIQQVWGVTDEHIATIEDILVRK